MSTFEELGKKLDKVAGQLKTVAQGGIEKTATETKEWGKYLDELADKIKKTAQDGVEKFATETKEFSQVTKLRSQIRDMKSELKEKFEHMGELSYQLKMYEQEDENLKKIGEEILHLEGKIKEKEDEIEKLKSR
ncbi:hypothetical protein IBX65_09385 [Candidatus Aerophobetes bacterium]|nr:hypothetical protein [Candidatus Aerophobetes bacterium]